MPPRDTMQRRAAAWRRASLAIDRMTHAKTQTEKGTARRWAAAWTAIARTPRRARARRNFHQERP